jgi:hypothetical protein
MNFNCCRMVSNGELDNNDVEMYESIMRVL